MPDARTQWIGIALANARADEVVDVVRAADDASIDFVTFDDAFAFPAGATEPDRLDALLLAARLAPVTTSIGLVPTVTVTHTEPFHNAKNVATLDWVSRGRAGWRNRSSAARTARSTSPSVAVGVPHTAMTASPMNFSTMPPYRPITSCATLK